MRKSNVGGEAQEEGASTFRREVYAQVGDWVKKRESPSSRGRLDMYE